MIVVAIPPIGGIGALRDNAANIFHITNLPHGVWQSKLERFFHEVQYHRHWVVPERRVGEKDIDRAAIKSVDDFVFYPVDDEALKTASITAVYVCKRPREKLLGAEMEQAIPAEWRHRRVEAEGRQGAFVNLQQNAGKEAEWFRTNLTETLDWVAAEKTKGTSPQLIVDGFENHWRKLLGS